MDDIWCDLCRDKMKQVRVQYGKKEIGICKHCESLCAEAVGTKQD